MIGQNKFADPLLGGNRQYNMPALEDLEQQKRALDQRIKEFKQEQVHNPAQPKSPVWDEIDSIVSGMSDQELMALNNNDEFIESSQKIQSILQAEYLKIMKPIVENTPQGKDALDKHLTLVKRLRKTAIDEVNRKYSEMDDYLRNYSNISFQEYQKMKQGGKRNDK